MREVDGVGTHGADEHDAERQRGGEEDADRSVLLDGAAAREEADADGDDERRDEGPGEQVGSQQVGDGHAGEDGVGERVSEERHGAQHDEAAEHRADDADDERRDQRALHELERERLGEPVDHRGLSPSQHWSITTMPSRKSAWPPKAAPMCSFVNTSAGRP